MILSCTCDYKDQDEIYGKKMRVMNSTRKGMSRIIYRCTVCKKERTG